MTELRLVFIGMMVALVAGMLPFAMRPAYAITFGNDPHRLEALQPAETAPVDMGTGAGEGVRVPMKPFTFGNDSRRLEALQPAETAPADMGTGAGEGTHLSMKPLTLGHDTTKLEFLAPSESGD